VQRTAARYALNDCSWRISVTTMLNSLEWPTLESHQVYSKLVMFYKIINNHIEVLSLSLSPMYTSTRGHSQHFRPPRVRLNTYLFSFLPSNIKLWKNGSMTPHLVESPGNLNLYKPKSVDCVWNIYNAKEKPLSLHFVDVYIRKTPTVYMIMLRLWKSM